MTTAKDRAAKDANARFGRLIGKEIPHVRLGQHRGDETWVASLGTLADLHGPDGVCTCCPRRAS